MYMLCQNKEALGKLLAVVLHRAIHAQTNMKVDQGPSCPLGNFML